MPNVVFIASDGVEHQVDVPIGWSLMEAARRDGIEGIVAECGGGAICGTCHVHIDPAWAAKTGEPEITESALLEIVPERSDTSRLACQVIMTEELDGLSVRIPAEQLAL